MEGKYGRGLNFNPALAIVRLQATGSSRELNSKTTKQSSIKILILHWR